MKSVLLRGMTWVFK